MEAMQGGNPPVDLRALAQLRKKRGLARIEREVRHRSRRPSTGA